MRVFLFLIGLIITDSALSMDKFGKTFEIKNKISADDAIKSYESIKGKEVQVLGVVEKVCVKKGCWMTLSGTNKPIRVTFKDYGFFVPSSLQGKDVVLNGQIFEKVENIDLQKHYLEDQGATKEQISKVTEDKKTYHFVATGVQAI